MQIPGLGTVTKDEDTDWYYSEPMSIPVLGAQPCQIIVEGYDDDPNPEDFHAAISNFIALGPEALTQAESHLFRYYQDCNDNWDPDDEEFIDIESAADIWPHVRLGNEPLVTRRSRGDRSVYISLECGCDWEPEHGLQIVFKNGLAVTKIGPYNGHLTNSDAYADSRLEHVVYKEA